MNPKIGLSGFLNSRTALGGIAMIVIGFWIYLPAIHGGWLWDDRDRIVDNSTIHSPDGYWKVWVRSDAQANYYPLSTEVEWLEWRFWGDNTFGYHLVSVALHVTSALLLWRLFSRLGFALAWVGAMLFLTHPLAVESVAWISEIKNTLSLPLLLMATLTWLDYDEKGDAENYRGALVWFALSLLAKTAGLLLPVFFLVYAWWKRGTIGLKDLRGIAPFLALALAAGLITLRPPHTVGSHLLFTPGWNVASGLASMGWTLLFIQGKCFLPVGLRADYPGFAITQPTAIDLLPWALMAGLVVLLGIGWRRAAWTRSLALGLGFFLLNLIPPLIYVGKNYEETPWSLDHATYLPMIGLIGWSIAALGNLRARLPKQARAVQTAVLGAVLVAFSCGSHAYARAFASQDIFWAYMIENDPRNWRAHYDSGVYELEEGRPANALAQFQKTIELQPNSDQAYYHLGKAFEALGNKGEAERCYLQAAKLNPHEMGSYIALAGLMIHEKDYAKAEKYLDEERIEVPGESSSRALLAEVMMKTGRKQEGMEFYREAVTMEPDVEQVRYNYGVALMQAGDLPGALEQLQAAVDLNGNFAPSRTNLGVVLAQRGAVAEAIGQFETAVQIAPNYLLARENLALALVQTGQIAGAIEQFRKVLEIDPTNARARGALEKLQSLQSAPTQKQ